MMKKIIIAILFLSCGIVDVNAACSGPAVMKDNSGSTFSMSLSTVPDGNCGSSMSPSAGSSGGASPSGVVAANSNNSTNLKASAGTVYGIQTSNISASTPYYLKLYDKATAPTCGTDTPVKRILIPPSNGGNNGVFPVGIKFTLGIGFCIVTGIADNDNTAVPAATILSNIDWN
jgi:hypothetical protein